MNNMNFFQLLQQSKGNPDNLINSMTANNPNLRAIINQARNSGMSIQDFTKQYAKQNNIDINGTMNMLKQMGFRF